MSQEFDDFDNMVQRLGMERLEGKRYVKRLAGGGQATACIYEEPSGQTVVAKLLIAPRSPVEVERFIAEAEALLKLAELRAWTHSIVRGLSKAMRIERLPILYFFMELAPGTSLASRLEHRPPPWNWQEALEMIMRITSALQPAHALQYVHRDLHPGNIMIDDSAYSQAQWKEDGTSTGVKVLDFGVHTNVITKMFKPEDPAIETFRPVGSVKHASPEALATPARVMPVSDMWSIGVIFYRLLTGKMPFFGDTLLDLARITSEGNYKEPDAILGAKPSEEKVVLKVLRGLLNPNQHMRLVSGELVKIARDILFEGLANACENEPELSDLYFRYAGDVWVCPECRNLVHPFGSRCSVCGRPQEEWLHWKFRT